MLVTQGDSGEATVPAAAREGWGERVGHANANEDDAYIWRSSVSGVSA